MYDSNYYRRQMSSYLELIKKTEDDKKQFKNLKSNLLNLDDSLPNVKVDLKDAEECFLNGGFISNNETFDNGTIDECCMDIDSISDDISNIISKINSKIIELDGSIVNYKNLYNSASNNYNSALLKDRGD